MRSAVVSEMDNRFKVQQQFDRQAAFYRTDPVFDNPSGLKQLTALARASATDSALDVATGCGHMALALASTCATTIGSDISDGMLRQAKLLARERGLEDRVHWVRADVERTPFADRSFNIVTCRVAAHHFVNPRAFLAESWRLLKRGGRLALQDCGAPAHSAAADFLEHVEKERDSSHAALLSEGKWKELIAAEGFAIQSLRFESHRHDYNSWMIRAGVSETKANVIWKSFLDNPPAVREIFRPEESDGVRTFNYWRITSVGVKN